MDIRKKVVSSYWSKGFFKLTLECGHFEVSYGTTPKGTLDRVAPKTAKCFKCSNEADNESRRQSNS